jgi:hypothetical protein
VVDIGRDAYTTSARLYPDSDRVFRIRWYQALPTARLLGVPSALNNLVFTLNKDEYLDTAVGELPLAQYTQQRPDTNPLALGQGVCGTPADFGGRGTIDEAPPFVRRRPDGLPMCCGEQIEGAGGLGLGGGSSTPTFSPVLAEVVSSTGTPPVHTCVQMTRDGSNNVVQTSPPFYFTQVLNPDQCPLPDGGRVQLYQIVDNPGWFWAEPILQFGVTDTVALSIDPDTDTVTGDVVTQLSVTSDTDGVKLVGDSVPSQGAYYGTPPDGDDLGYQDFDDAVTASTGNQSTVNAMINAIIALAPQFGLVAVAIGGGALALAVDGTIASTIDETLTNSATVEVDDDAVLDVVQTQTVYENDFNAAGFIIDRTANAPTTTRTSVTFDGSDTVSVTGSAADASITMAAIYQQSIDADADGLRLVGDELDPGPGYVYGTDAGGDKGWNALDGVWLEAVGSVVSHVGPGSAVVTINYPVLLTIDAKGHIVSATGGSAPVTGISTSNSTGGPITGAITLAGGTGITLSVASQTITINSSGGGAGPPPTSAPTLTATPGDTQVSLAWTAVSPVTSYQLYRGSTLIDTTTGLSFTDTGLTNGTLYSYSVYGVNNGQFGPAGTASATPFHPAATSQTSSGASGTMTLALPTNASGDLLVVGLTYDSTSVPASPPTGWTSVFATSGAISMVVYSRTSTGSIASVTVASQSQTGYRSIALNVGSRSVVSSTFSSSGGTPGLTATCHTLTAGATGNVLVDFYTTVSTSVGITGNDPVVVNLAWMCADFMAVGAGTTPANTATLGSSQNWVTCTVLTH